MQWRFQSIQRVRRYNESNSFPFSLQFEIALVRTQICSFCQVRRPCASHHPMQHYIRPTVQYIITVTMEEHINLFSLWTGDDTNTFSRKFCLIFAASENLAFCRIFAKRNVSQKYDIVPTLLWRGNEQSVHIKTFMKRSPSLTISDESHVYF